MARSVIVDAGFLVALLSRRDGHRQWAVGQASELPPPWLTCEAALSEAFHLIGAQATAKLGALLQRNALFIGFELANHLDPVLSLMEKYADVPMSFADACLVRMTETLANPVILTTDTDFRVYRRHSRHVIPCKVPH